jgi:8-oxo-dGTP pyrophosphatase MutT (NUDIX family)
MVRQYRHGASQVVLELPGGRVDSSDALPEDAGCRELAEETGFLATNIRTVASFYVNPATHTNRVHTCVATGVVQVSAPRLDEGEEGLSVELVPIAEIVGGLFSGKITQSMHVTSIIMALSSIERISIVK